MRITRITAWPVEMKLAEPYSIAYETTDCAVNVFVRMETNGPISGYGCAAPDLEVTGESAESVEKALGEIVERGGDYVADNRLTVADLRVYVQTRSLRSGMLDHVPTDLVDQLAPRLVEHEERLAAHPVVTGYYDDLEKS